MEPQCLNASCTWDQCFTPWNNACVPGAATLAAAPVVVVVHAWGALLALAFILRKATAAGRDINRVPLLRHAEGAAYDPALGNLEGGGVGAYHTGVYMPPANSQPVG